MFCQNCGKEIDDAAIVCPACGVSTANFHKANNAATQPQINIVNTNTNTNTNTNNNMGAGRPLNKWTAFLLCLFLGYFGAHKFYERKTGMGILYLFTFGLFGIGWLIDLIVILCKPNPYYV